MKIKVLATGSSGNGYLITDSTGEVLVVEAGVDTHFIVGNTPYSPIGFIYSHKHKDHYRYFEKYKSYFSYLPTDKHYKKYNIGNYNVWSFPVLHDVENRGFIIANKVEKKVIFFATDLIYNSASKSFYTDVFKFINQFNVDYYMIESSYNEYEFRQSLQSNSDVFGVKNHLSNYECARFLSHTCNRNEVQNIMLIHGSNRIGRSIKGKKTPIKKLIPKAQIIIANKGTEVYF